MALVARKSFQIFDPCQPQVGYAIAIHCDWACNKNIISPS